MTLPLNDTDRLHVAATTEQLSVIRDFVRLHVRQAGFSEHETNNIVLAVDEACANLIQHAYQNDPTKSIDVRIVVRPSEINVEIMDTSTPFDPGKADLPDMRRYFAEHRHHGLGILLMTRVMDGIEYVPSGEGRHENTLILTKLRTA
jgi:serine/threonine-protein kinase RsbW